MFRSVIWALALLVPLPVALAQEPPRKEGAAKGLQVEGKLTAEDPMDRVRKSSPHKVHTFMMTAGRTYVISMKSGQFDTYLRLEDPAGKQLAENDDADGTFNSKIIFTCHRSGNYRIIATAYDGKGTYTLTVDEVSGALAKFLAVPGLIARYEAAFQNKEKDAEKILKEAEAAIEEVLKEQPNKADEVKELAYRLKHLTLGRPAMEIEGEDINGKKFKLSDYRGKVVVLDFWGHW